MTFYEYIEKYPHDAGDYQQYLAALHTWVHHYGYSLQSGKWGEVGENIGVGATVYKGIRQLSITTGPTAERYHFIDGQWYSV